MFKAIAKGSLVIFIFKILGTLCAFFTSIIISRFFGPEMFGEYSLIISIISFTSILNIFGMDLFFIRRLNELDNDKRKIYLVLNVFKRFFIIGFGISVLMFLLRNVISETFLNNNFLFQLGLVGIISLFFSTIRINSKIYRAHENLFKFSINDNLVLQAPLLLIILIVFLLKYSAVHPINFYYISISFSFLISILILFFFLKKKYGIKNILKKSKLRKVFVNERSKQNILLNSYPMMLTSSVILIMSYVDSFMISGMLDNFALGLYSGIRKLAIPLVFMAGAVSNYLSPKIAVAYAKGKLADVQKMYKHTIIILASAGVVTLLILLLFGDFFLGLFGSEYVSETETYNVYLIANFISGALFGPVGYFLVMTHNHMKFLYILIFALLLNVTLNFILIPVYGILGAAIATLTSSFCWKLLGFILLKKKKII